MPRDQFTRTRTFRNEPETSFSRCPVFCGKALLLLAQLMLLWEHINITVHPQQGVTSKPWGQTWITITSLNWEGREVVSPVAGEHIVPSCLVPVSLARARVPLLAHCTPHQKAAGWEAGCVKDVERITWVLESVPQKPEVMCPVGAAKKGLHEASQWLLCALATGKEPLPLWLETAAWAASILQHAASYTWCRSQIWQRPLLAEENFSSRHRHGSELTDSLCKV